MKFSFVRTRDHISVVNSETGESGSVMTDNKNYDEALQALRDEDYDAFMLIANPISVFHKFADDRIVIVDGLVSIDGEMLHGCLANRMVDAIQDGFGIDPLVKFLVNLDENPSKRAVDELYGFLEHTDLTITIDGHFVAYKKVREDYTDCHSGKFDNSPGKFCEMKRNLVDDDKNRTCSKGLHFCGRGYLDSYCGDRTVIVKINPRDVVSIPVDYNFHKGRACKYEVIGELDNGRDESGERLEQELEGSVFDGEGMDMFEETSTPVVIDGITYSEPREGMNPGTIHACFNTRQKAQDYARDRDLVRFKDMNRHDDSFHDDQRWAVVYV